MGSETLFPPERLKADVQYLKDWMSKEPHLPQIEDEEWLITFLHHNKYSLEKTKIKLDRYFTYRNKHPELLKNRDPKGSDIAAAGLAVTEGVAEKLTKDNERLLFTRYWDPSLFDIYNHLKRMFMFLDVMYLENDRHKAIVSISDCKNITYGHLLRALPQLKTGIDLFFNAYSDRLKAFHIINVPAGLDKVLNAFKSFLPEKIAERFFVHSTPEDLRKMVDEEVLCSDFGGKGPCLDEYAGKCFIYLLKCMVACIFN